MANTRSRPESQTVARRTGIILDRNDLERSIPGLVPFLDRAIAGAMKYHEAPAENYMKVNAPWKDRTTNARNGLAARYQGANDKGQHEMVLFHQVDYGIWLEIKNDGEYAIILPTIQEFGPKVMDTLKGILNGYRFGGAS